MTLQSVAISEFIVKKGQLGLDQFCLIELNRNFLQKEQ